MKVLNNHMDFLFLKSQLTSGTFDFFDLQFGLRIKN
jgi:hypothetical protein